MWLSQQNKENCANKHLTQIFYVKGLIGYFSNISNRRRKIGKKSDASSIIAFDKSASKVLEELLISKIWSFLTSCNQILDHQFSFREKHGTTEQIRYIFPTMNAVNEKKYCEPRYSLYEPAHNRG